MTVRCARAVCTVSADNGCRCAKPSPLTRLALGAVVLLACVPTGAAISAADPPPGLRVDEDGRVVGGDRPTVLGTIPYAPDDAASADPTRPALATSVPGPRSVEEGQPGGSTNGGMSSSDVDSRGDETPLWDAERPLSERVLYWGRLALIGLAASVALLIVLRWGRRPSTSRRLTRPVDPPGPS